MAKKKKTAAAEMDNEQIVKALWINKEIQVLNEKIKELKQELEPINAYFDAKLSHGETLEKESGSVRKVVKNSYSLVQEQVPLLQEVFGDFFSNYVSAPTNFKHTKSLLDIWKNKDSKYYPYVKDAIENKETHTFEYSLNV